MDSGATFQPGWSHDFMWDAHGCRESLQSSRGSRRMAPSSCFTNMSSLCLSNQPTALMAACGAFVKGSFHVFVEMINNAPSQILQEEQMSCNATVYSSEQSCRFVKLLTWLRSPTSPPKQFGCSQHTSVKWQENGFGWELQRCFSWLVFFSMYILSSPWTSVVFISGCRGQRPCVVPCFHRWTWLWGTDDLPSFGLFRRLLTGTEEASDLYRWWLDSMFPV